MDVLILLFLFVAVVTIMARSSVVERMAEARIEDGDLWVTLRGLNKVWAGRGDLTIPLTSVTGVAVDPSPQNLAGGGLRLPGVWIPRLLVAGSYRKPGFRSFIAIRYGRDALVLDLDAFEYDRIVIDVDRPEDLAQQIEAERRDL